jgi:hypothetical protein
LNVDRAKVLQKAKQTAGLLLIALGLVLFYVAASVIAASGLEATLLSTWAAAGLVFVGSYWLFSLSMRYSLGSLLVMLVALFGWSMIMLIQLPSDLQILLASIVSFVSVLIYRQWSRKKALGSQSLFNRGRRLPKFVGIFLFVLGVVLLFSLVDIAEVFGLFCMWLVSIPLCLDVLVGFQLMRGKGLKDALVGWSAYVILTLIPFVVFMPLAYQIPAIILMLTAIVFGLYTYRKSRLRSIKSARVCSD